MKNMENFTFMEFNEAVVINKYLGKEAEVGIPAVINGKSVTEISAECFANNQSLEKVKIPSSVKFIGSNGFYKCINLKEIVFTEGVKKIGNNAFAECKKLIQVTLPSSVKIIGENIFDNCCCLKNISVDKNFKYHGDRLINDIHNLDLSSINIFSVEKQCEYVINKLKANSGISLKEKSEIMLYIRKKRNLKKRIFLENQPEIISMLLHENISLSSNIIDECLYNSSKKGYAKVAGILLYYKENNCTGKYFTNYQEEIALIETGERAPTVKMLKEKWNVGKIKGGIRITGYKGTSKMETIPKHTLEGIPILNIGYVKGNNFMPIEHLTIDADIENFSNHAFQNCKSLRTITLPNTIKDLGYSTFSGCENLTKINIPTSVTKLKSELFMDCKSLVDISIPNSVTQLGTRNNPGVFQNCKQLEVVNLSENLTHICSNTFSNCINLKTIVIPKNTTYIGEKAFKNCHKLNDLTCEIYVKNIAINAFQGCQNLHQKPDKFANLYTSDKPYLEFSGVPLKLLPYSISVK